MTTDSTRSLPLTETGRAFLREELDRLVREREPQLVERLREARAGASADDMDGFLAVEELARVRQRIAELERVLSAVPVEPAPEAHGTVTIGSRVTVRDDKGREHIFVLVSPIEADAKRGHISIESPVGAALLARRAGEQVRFSVPTGERMLDVITVE